MMPLVVFLTGIGTLASDHGRLTEVPYSLEIGRADDIGNGDGMSSLDSFHGRITLDAGLATALAEDGVVLTLTLQDGRSLVCQVVNADGELMRLAGGTFDDAARSEANRRDVSAVPKADGSDQ